MTPSRECPKHPERAIESLAARIQRQMCGYDGEKGRIREREILTTLRAHFWPEPTESSSSPQVTAPLPDCGHDECSVNGCVQAAAPVVCPCCGHRTRHVFGEEMRCESLCTCRAEFRDNALQAIEAARKAEYNAWVDLLAQKMVRS